MSDSESDTAPRATVAFSLPQRRKNAFVSRMRTAAGNKAIVVKIGGCQVLSVKSLVSSADSAQDGAGAGGGGGSGYLAKILLPLDSPATQRMLAMDAEAETAGAEKNAAWFSNNLTPDDMRAMFRASIGASPDGGDSLLATVLVSDVKEPRPLTLDGIELDSSEAIAEMSLTAAGRAQLRGCQATCVLEAQGLYFYARRFGVRWCLRSLALTTPAAVAAEASAAAELTADDRATIESHWAAEVAAFGARMDAAAAALQRRKAEAAELLAAAVALPAKAEREWNATLEALRRNLYAAPGAPPAPAGGA
jgi:hypothetical protein